jgi:ABC-type transporter Mla subunit MlaD
VTATDRQIIDTIQAAATATAELQQIVDRASHYLADFKANRNALGVFMEPHTLRENLKVVRAEMDRAIKIIDTAKWPTARDYNRT